MSCVVDCTVLKIMGIVFAECAPKLPTCCSHDGADYALQSVFLVKPSDSFMTLGDTVILTISDPISLLNIVLPS